MKSRIWEVYPICKEEPVQAQVMQVVARIQRFRLSKSNKIQQIIKHIIHNTAFDISTIDKFTHKVIRAFAHDLKCL
jgi:ribosomal protein S3AE